MKTYEYKFVRLGEYRGSALFGVKDKARKGYEDVVRQHARDGWRLVQIFAPGVAAFGAAKYYELIFERESGRRADRPIESHVQERTGGAKSRVGLFWLELLAAHPSAERSQTASIPAWWSANRPASSASGKVESFAIAIRDGRCRKIDWPFMPSAA